MSTMLTKSDVDALLRNRSEETRATIANKVATAYTRGGLTDAERTVAHDIFQMVARDAAVLVRATLAENLKSCDTLPRGVARVLARDVERVALPILEYSMVLADDDLIEIIEIGNTRKNMAIARRPMVSVTVSDALVATNQQDVVITLFGNQDADIAEDTIQSALSEFRDNEPVSRAVVSLPALPPAITERLLLNLSGKLLDELLSRHALPPNLADEFAIRTREQATLKMLSSSRLEDDVVSLVKGLARNARLTDSIVLRALLGGDHLFFDASLAQRIGVPLENVRALRADAGRRGLVGALRSARMSPDLAPAIEAVTEAMSEISINGSGPNRALARQVAAHYDDLPADSSIEEALRYLLSL